MALFVHLSTEVKDTFWALWKPKAGVCGVQVGRTQLLVWPSLNAPCREKDSHVGGASPFRIGIKTSQRAGKFCPSDWVSLTGEGDRSIKWLIGHYGCEGSRSQPSPSAPCLKSSLSHVASIYKMKWWKQLERLECRAGDKMRSKYKHWSFYHQIVPLFEV